MKQSSKKAAPQKTKAGRGRIWIAVCAGALTLTAVAVIVLLNVGKAPAGGDSTNGGGLTIVKSDITGTPKFYAYKAGGTKMEILAVKASDGTIRTAFNTCQVCYSSGRGYYKVQGNTLVCQNCGNVFSFDQIEKEKGGCNPVPVPENEKTDSGTSITISADYLNQAKQIFANWKK